MKLLLLLSLVGDKDMETIRNYTESRGDIDE